MVEYGNERGDERVEPPPERTVVHDLGELDLVEPEDGADGVDDPAGVEIALLDVRVDELDDGAGVAQTSFGAEVIHQAAHGEPLAEVLPAGVVHPVPRSVEYPGPVFPGHQGNVVAFTAAEGDPDFVDDPARQGLQDLDLPLEGQELFIPAGGEDDDHRDLLLVLDLLHPLPVHGVDHQERERRENRRPAGLLRIDRIHELDHERSQISRSLSRLKRRYLRSGEKTSRVIVPS